MKPKNPYKLTSDGMFCNFWIDQQKLNHFKLEAYKDDKKVLSRKVEGFDRALDKALQYQETVQPTITRYLREADRS